MLGRAGEVAIEAKAGALDRRRLAGIRAYVDEHRPRRAIVVGTEPAARRTAEGIDILPWQQFLERLWRDEVVN